MVMALSLTTNAMRLSPEWTGDVPRTLAKAAQALSKQLGYGEAETTLAT